MKQILAFLFCFTRELNLYPPLTFSLCLPIHPYLTHHPPIHPPIHPSTHPSGHPSHHLLNPPSTLLSAR